MREGSEESGAEVVPTVEDDEAGGEVVAVAQDEAGQRVEILAAQEIRQVRADELDCFDPPRAPRILPRPTCQFCHLYVWQDGAWTEFDPETHAPEGAAP